MTRSRIRLRSAPLEQQRLPLLHQIHGLFSSTGWKKNVSRYRFREPLIDIGFTKRLLRIAGCR
jgi:hypothetical protein